MTLQVKGVIGGDAPSQPITSITWNGELPLAAQTTFSQPETLTTNNEQNINVHYTIKSLTSITRTKYINAHYTNKNINAHYTNKLQPLHKLVQFFIERMRRHRLGRPKYDKLHAGTCYSHVHTTQVAKEAYVAAVVRPYQ